MLKKMYGAATIFLLIAFIMNPQIVLSELAADVKYKENRLSAHARGIPLKQLLSEVTKQTGVVFSYDDAVSALPVTVHFENNTLPDGIERILSPRFNYAAVYDKSNQIKSVSILKRKKKPVVTAENQTGQSDTVAVSKDVSEPVESLEEFISIALADEEEDFFSKVPPDRDETLPPFSAVDPNVPPPPGEEPIPPVIDIDAPPPPGMDLEYPALQK